MYEAAVVEVPPWPWLRLAHLTEIDPSDPAFTLRFYDFKVGVEPPPPLPLYWTKYANRRSAERIAAARKALTEGPWCEDGALPSEVVGISAWVRVDLGAYKELREDRQDQLYVLEFQGPHVQYIKFGHTKNLSGRVKTHSDLAEAHGFALLNGWASPGLADARPAEKELLAYARHFKHLRVVAQERFYGMRYETARDLARAVYSERYMHSE
ncbi:hypothetical protein ACFHW2_11900 [Actinomadura sp. LOL_016]|uniref:hypothetical protein n=1 Tax=unclassified Actinomadura TaxID=2626254 RepID=UPI003A7F8B06